MLNPRLASSCGLDFVCRKPLEGDIWYGTLFVVVVVISSSRSVCLCQPRYAE